MLIVMFGTRTPYGHFGFTILEHIMDVVYGDHYRIHCLDLLGLRNNWLGRDSRPVLVTSDRPDVELSKFLIASGFPCLAFVDEPDDAIASAIQVDGMHLHQAIRFSTQYFSCLGNAIPADKVRIFGSIHCHANSTELIEDILDEIFGIVDETVTARVLERMAPENHLRNKLSVHELMTRYVAKALLPGHARKLLPEEDQELIKAVADGYRPIFEKREITPFEWPRDMFLASSDGPAYVGDVDLVGRARYIVWGPYLCLPAGAWRATIQFEVVDNISGNEIEADICIDMEDVVSIGRAVLPVVGIFEFGLDFSVINPTSPIEIRILLRKGAIEGRFGLRKVLLNRRLDADPDAQVLALRGRVSQILPIITR
jgi:hypothetical protein